MSDSSTPVVDSIGRQSLADRVSDRLLDMILSEGMNVDDSLPSTSELARRFDVSVVVIREAVAKLAGLDIVRRRQGRETVVSLPEPNVIGRLLRAHTHFKSISVDELQLCRTALEVDAAWSAASKNSPEFRRAELEPTIVGMTAARTPEEFIGFDLAFHLRLAELGGNRASQLLLESMSGLIRETLQVTSKLYAARVGTSGLRESADMHRAIFDSVVGGDPRGAAAAMVRHFTYVQNVDATSQYAYLLETEVNPGV